MVFDRVWDICHCLSNKFCYEISFIKIKACILMDLWCSWRCCAWCSKISSKWSLYQVYHTHVRAYLDLSPILASIIRTDEFHEWDSKSLFQEKTIHDRSQTTDQQGHISSIGPVTDRIERPASNLSVRTYQNWKDQLGCEWNCIIIISQTPASKI